MMRSARRRQVMTDRLQDWLGKAREALVKQEARHDD